MYVPVVEAVHADDTVDDEIENSVYQMDALPGSGFLGRGFRVCVFRVLGLRVQGLGFGVWGLGF